MAQLRRIPALVFFAVALALCAVAALAQESISSDIRAIGFAVAAAAGGLVMSAISWAKARFFSPPDPVVEQLERRIADLQTSRASLREEAQKGESALIAELRSTIEHLRTGWNEREARLYDDWGKREDRYVAAIDRRDDRIKLLERLAAGRPKVAEEQYDTDDDAVSPLEREEISTHSGMAAYVPSTTWSGDDTGGGLG